MAYSKQKTTKSGKQYFEIFVSRGRGLTEVSTRWYVPEGWSKRAIMQQLKREEADFQRRVDSGEIISRKEKKAVEEAKALENEKIATLKQFGERVFMPTKQLTISENTRLSFQQHLNNHIYPALGSFKLPDISAADINAFLLKLQTDSGKYSVASKCYTVLNLLFKMAYMNDIIPVNPMLKVEHPKTPKTEKKTEVEAYSATEIKYILNCLKNEPIKWQAYVWLVIDTGIRRGEACALKWSNIDFNNNVILINSSLGYSKEKGGTYDDTTKNGKSRYIAIDPDLSNLLKCLHNEQIAETDERKKASKGAFVYPIELLKYPEYVFTQNGTSLPMNPQSPTRYMKNFEKSYHVDHMHPHKLRHSFASIAITNGADIASISEILGHSDVAVTLRVYTHANEESKRRASNVFREAIKEG